MPVVARGFTRQREEAGAKQAFITLGLGPAHERSNQAHTRSCEHQAQQATQQQEQEQEQEQQQQKAGFD